MAYTVLARKYRSWTFDQLVGQEPVATTLKNAIRSGRIHHGYLFTGTRGVGKTSAARILARSLNCLTSEGPTGEPCCKCESCTAIAEGQDVDVIEIDAASNTGVDNIRELRSNTIYRPARARFKIYIIDEVHMLSPGAFNALLKTLEEPPGHVKFIMATTEPQKVPATIQSRCQRFDFRSIGADRIAGHFEWILKQEKIEADAAVIRRIARLANGSMRDGLSLLDQVLAVGGDRITLQTLEDLLPASHDELLTRIIERIAEHDAGGALVALDEAVSAGYSLERLAESLAEQVRTLMLLKICGADSTLVDIPSTAHEAMAALAGKFEAEHYVAMIAMLEELRRTVRFSALARALADAAIVRMASAVSYRSIQSLLDALGSAPAPAGAAPATTSPAAARATPRSATPRNATPRSAAPAPATPNPARTTSYRRESTPPAAPARATTPRPTSEKRPSSSATGSSRVNSKELDQVRADPGVRQAMDLFGGTLVNVERVRSDPAENGADDTPGESPPDVTGKTEERED